MNYYCTQRMIIHDFVLTASDLNNHLNINLEIMIIYEIIINYKIMVPIISGY